MAHRSISLPLTIIVVCLLVIGTILIAPSNNPQAAPLRQDGTATAYALAAGTSQAQTATSTAGYPLTQTAKALPTSTPTTEQNETNTPTFTPESSLSEATNTPTPTESPTSSPTPTTAPTPETPTLEATPTPTPTPTPDPEADIVDCSPGVAVTIEGDDAPSEVSLVIYMGRYNSITRKKRFLPIGGGLSDAAGRYKLSLTMGEESNEQSRYASPYVVHIRVRDSMDLVRILRCRVDGELPRTDLDMYR